MRRCFRGRGWLSGASGASLRLAPRLGRGAGFFLLDSPTVDFSWLAAVGSLLGDAGSQLVVQALSRLLVNRAN